MKWLNSFRFQLFSAALILVILLAAAILFGLRTASSAANYQATVNLIGQQRTNALLIDTTFDQLTSPNLTEAEHNSLHDLIVSLVTNFDQGQSALRSGDTTLGITGIENPNALSLLDELDARWSEFRSTTEELLASDDSALEALDPTINTQASATYTFADRLAKAINTLVQQDLATAQQIMTGIVALSAFFMVASTIIINNTARSVNRLARAADQLGKGDLKTRANVGRINEIAHVAQVFNNMAGQIEERIAETQEAQEKAERSDKVKSAFLASMSHELRTPLNAVINFSRFVVDGDTGPVNEQQIELLNEVIGSAKHLLNLINDVLDMSKIEAGSLNLFIEDDIRLDSVLESVVSTGRGLLAGKPVRLNTAIDDRLPLLRCDRQRIVQILLNIMSNACKFTEEGEITVKAYAMDDEVLISVADTGSGIAAEDQRLVFEPFKQTRTGIRQGGGTGLGMPIAKSLAEAHGGRIWLESEHGRGTTFYVALPIQAEINAVSVLAA